MSRKRWLVGIIAVILLTTVAVVFDIPVLRQVLGFLYLTLLPGILILLSLRARKLALTEAFVLSVGISIAFIMFFGFLINHLLFSLGYTTPLSAKSLIFSFSPILILLAFIGYKRNKEAPPLSMSDFSLNTKEKLFLLLPSVFPFLSIFGMYFMNATSNNLILLVLLFLLPIYVVYVSFSHRQVPDKAYPLMIFMLSISLVLLFALRSNHIMGADIHDEYYYFRLTLNDFHWRIRGATLLSACLSVTLLPTVYQSLLNIDGEFLFKLLYSLLFSTSPLIIYVVAKKYIGNFYAFLASMLFMSQTVFLHTGMNARTSLAILFFGLALLVLFHNEIGALNKRIFFIVFLISTLVSHYSTTYLFFFILLGSWLVMEALTLMASPRQKPERIPRGLTSGLSALSPPIQHSPSFGRNISGTVVALFFAAIFLWYSQITEVAFAQGINYVVAMFRNLQHFFILEARQPAEELLSPRVAPTIPARIQYLLTWAIFAFIAIGVSTMIVRYKEAILPDSRRPGLDFLKARFGAEYYIVVVACIMVLLYYIVLPTKGAPLYSQTRSYLQMLVFLSPFFVIGGITIARYLRLPAYMVILLILMPYFMCTSGTMYQMFGIDKEVILNSEGRPYEQYFIHDQESYAARWLGNHTDKPSLKVYADFVTGASLVSQAEIPTRPWGVFLRSLEPNKPVEGDSYIFLGYWAFTTAENPRLSIYKNMLAGQNKLYANGGSEVYKSFP